MRILPVVQKDKGKDSFSAELFEKIPLTSKTSLLSQSLHQHPPESQPVSAFTQQLQQTQQQQQQKEEIQEQPQQRISATSRKFDTHSWLKKDEDTGKTIVEKFIKHDKIEKHGLPKHFSQIPSSLPRTIPPREKSPSPASRPTSPLSRFVDKEMNMSPPSQLEEYKAFSFPVSIQKQSTDPFSPIQDDPAGFYIGRNANDLIRRDTKSSDTSSVMSPSSASTLPRKKASMKVHVRRNSSAADLQSVQSSESLYGSYAAINSPAASFLGGFGSADPSTRTTAVEIPGADGEYMPGDEIGPYTLKKEIGIGATSKVFEAQHSLESFPSPPSFTSFAVKIVPKNSLQSSLTSCSLNSSSGASYLKARNEIMCGNEKKQEETIPQDDALTLLEKETSIWSQLHHPNIISLHDVVESDNAVFVVSEMAKGGTLLEALQRHPKGIKEWTTKRLFKDICFAIKYMHDMKYVHRDIKLENILLANRNGPFDRDDDREDEDLINFSAKLADFGLSDLISEESPKSASGGNFPSPNSANQSQEEEAYCVGSLHYCSPEEIRQLSSRNPQSDVWSLGCVLYAMLSGTLPFNDDFLPRLQATIINSRYNKERLKEARCSDEVIALIEGMLKVKLADRFCMDDIIRHPWFSL